MEFPSGEVYRGEWKDNLRNGWGIAKTPDGFEYNGQWVNDNRHGTVMITDRRTGIVEKWIFENDKKVKQI